MTDTVSDRPMTSYPTKSSSEPTNYPQPVSSQTNYRQSRIPTYSPSFAGGYNTQPNQWTGSTPYTSSYTPSYASPYAPQYGDSSNNQYSSPFGFDRGNQQLTPSGYNNGPSNSNSGNYNTGGYNQQQSIPYASRPYNDDSYDSSIPYNSGNYGQQSIPYGSVPYNQGYGQQPLSYGPSSEYTSGIHNANVNQAINAAVINQADSSLSTCSAFVCVEFQDSIAYGSSISNSFASQSNQASVQQGGGGSQFVNLVDTGVNGAFSQFAVYGQLPLNTVTAFPFYSSNGAQQVNSFTFGNSQSSQASTIHNDYYNDNHQRTVTGKKCGTYVCAHRTDSASVNQIGPNYQRYSDYANYDQAQNNF